MFRAIQFRLRQIVILFVPAFATMAFVSSAHAAGAHGGGGMGGFHGSMGGGFHDDGHVRGGCCFFGLGFGGFGWPFSNYGYGYPSYLSYGYGAPYPYYPTAPGTHIGPATPGPMSFAVYFATGSDRLNAAAHNVVMQAAAAEAHANAQIAVAGFTDAAGNGASNLDLSRRRAETVRAALVAAGVPAHLIALVWHGDEGLQVPTANGVAEAQNRRVVILLGAPPPPTS